MSPSIDSRPASQGRALLLKPAIVAGAVGAISLAMLLGALGSQYLGGLAPCELCHWQRWPHAIAVGLCAAALMVRPVARPFLALAGAALATGAAIAFYHVGVEAGWWAGTAACAGALPEGLDPAELLARIEATPVARCDVPAWLFLGLSMAAWNALISVPLAGWALVAAARRARLTP